MTQVAVSKPNRLARTLARLASARRLHRRRHPHPDRQIRPRLFRNTRPDDLLVATIKNALAQVPTLDPKAIEDAIIGCASPKASRA
jgi:hypothetical protein